MLANFLKKFRPDDLTRPRLGGLHMSFFLDRQHAAVCDDVLLGDRLPDRMKLRQNEFATSIGLPNHDSPSPRLKFGAGWSGVHLLLEVCNTRKDFV